MLTVMYVKIVTNLCEYVTNWCHFWNVASNASIAGHDLFYCNKQQKTKIAVDKIIPVSVASRWLNFDSAFAQEFVNVCVKPSSILKRNRGIDTTQTSFDCQLWGL